VNKFSKMVLVGMVLSTNVQAQDSVYVHTEKDEFTGSVTQPRIMNGDRPHILFGSEGEFAVGISIRPVHPEVANTKVMGMRLNSLRYDKMVVALNGMGCHDTVYLTVLFEDGSKYEMWNNEAGVSKFACEGAAVLHPAKTTFRGLTVQEHHPIDFDAINKPIKGIRVVNMNRVAKSVTYYTQTDSERNFLIDQVAAIRKWRGN
jgi:hypothetical protein